MLKPKSSQGSGCIHVHQTRRNSLNKRYLPARKLMASVFWETKRALVVEFMEQGTTITSEVYRKTVKKTAQGHSEQKKSGMLTSGVVLLHRNVRPHTVARTRALLKRFNWELFDHPPYSPDLAPSDYHLKNWLESQHVNNNEELMESIKTWLRLQAAGFFDTGIQNLFPDTSDYFEK
jgi:transposase